jgi:hypothetical protein
VPPKLRYIHCSFCGRPAVAYYELTKVEKDGTKHGPQQICSLLCLVRWSYEFGTKEVQRGVGLLRGVVRQLTGVLEEGSKR